MQNETQRMNDIISRNARINFAEISKMVNKSKNSKPQGYDKHISKMRDYLKGNQKKHIEESLKKKFPKTWQKMGASSLNIVKHDACVEATAYTDKVERLLLMATEAEKKNFEIMLDKWRLDTVMPLLEQRLIACKTMFLRFNWARDLDEELMRDSYPRITILYPDKVHVLADERAPYDIQAAKMIAVDISSSEREAYEIWTRHGTEIQVSTHFEDGTQTETQVWRGKSLPFVVFHDGRADESVYLDDDRDHAVMQENINDELTDRDYRTNYNSHKMLWTSGGDPSQKEQVVGAGEMLILDEMQKIGTVDMTIADSSLDDIIKKLKLHSVSRNQNPDVWNISSPLQISGLSRMIGNSAANKKRNERIIRYKLIEERFMLPLIVDITNVYSDLKEVKMGEFEVIFPPAKVYEDPMAQTNKILVQQDGGWMTPAASAVKAGVYHDLEEALSAGVSNEYAMVEGKGTGTLKHSGE